MEPIIHLNLPEQNFFDAPLAWQKMGLQQTVSGYGRKLATSRKVWIGNRAYRVYVAQVGNAGSAWIEVTGSRFYIG